MLTSGTSGGLVLAMMALLDPGDEIIIPDPWFVAYPAMARVCEAKAVPCPLGPDFRMTADKVAPLITSKTRAVLLNAPANPTGVLPTQAEMDALARLCREKGVILISDEIYDAFVFPDGLDEEGRMPSPPSASPSGPSSPRLLAPSKTSSSRIAKPSWSGWCAAPSDSRH